jgi:hypothetical protein
MPDTTIVNSPTALAECKLALLGVKTLAPVH